MLVACRICRMVSSPVLGSISSMLFSFNSRSQSYLENFPQFAGAPCAVDCQRACTTFRQCRDKLQAVGFLLLAGAGMCSPGSMTKMRITQA